jgi:uncharacterized protein YjdB
MGIIIFPFSAFALEDENNQEEIVEQQEEVLEEQQEEIEEEKEEPQVQVRSSLNATEEKYASILYRTHIQDIGWEKDFAKDGTTSGTSHQSKRLEAIEIKIETNLSVVV